MVGHILGTEFMDAVTANPLSQGQCFGILNLAFFVKKVYSREIVHHIVVMVRMLLSEDSYDLNWPLQFILKRKLKLTTTYMNSARDAHATDAFMIFRNVTNQTYIH